ncbi:MAG TPA: hypothetical protein VEO19_02515 [Terriglobia bacterium]|nr:hypothetical protein [Terriglobia bacterium]
MLRKSHSSILTTVVSVCLWCGMSAYGQSTLSNEPNLTDEQKMDFLLHAKVIASKGTSKGITHPYRLTLTDGTLTHDASFQPVDEHKFQMTFDDGHTELNFVDSYHYNIAASELARMLGMGDMVPPYVERKWSGMTGSISWWVPWKWDEVMRHQQGLHPPDPDAWNKQMYKIRVFDQLVYDTDPNLTNVLITEDWKIWRIDFTRAFRQQTSLLDPKDLVMCDRQLLQKLKDLKFDEVFERTKPHLKKVEVKAVLARRDKIVDIFQKLVAEKGQGAVLY